MKNIMDAYISAKFTFKIVNCNRNEMKYFIAESYRFSQLFTKYKNKKIHVIISIQKYMHVI